MKRIVPDWYPQFHCIASQCRHSCCIGWEVDIDEDSLNRYKAVEGDFGERLRGQIVEGDCPHFLLGEGDRCPFLNGENLCDIYIELGEDALCQICTDHPRWRNWFADRVEEGLGLCCEEATRLMLTHPTPTQLLEQEMEGEDEEAGEDYLELLSLRQKLLSILQNRAKPLQQRICEGFLLFGISEEKTPFEEDITFLQGLESLTTEWKQWLAGDLKPQWREEWDNDGEQLLTYLIHRYFLPWGLERWAEDFPLRFGVFSLGVLGALYAGVEELTLEHRVEFIRAWSAELEYSEENLEAVADYLL